MIVAGAEYVLSVAALASDRVVGEKALTAEAMIPAKLEAGPRPIQGRRRKPAAPAFTARTAARHAKPRKTSAGPISASRVFAFAITATMPVAAASGTGTRMNSPQGRSPSGWTWSSM